MSEWVLHYWIHVVNLHSVSPWSRQAKAVLHMKEAQSMCLVAGLTPALVELPEQCAAAFSWRGMLSASPSTTHFCTLSGWAFLAQDTVVFKWISWQTANLSISCRKCRELSIYNMRGDGQPRGGRSGQSSGCAWPTGRGCAGWLQVGWERVRILKGCRWWGRPGDRLWVAVLFVFQIGWRFSFFHWNPLEENRIKKSGSQRQPLWWRFCILESTEGLPRGGWVPKPLELYTRVLCLCKILRGKRSLFCISFSKESMTQTYQEPLV